MVFPSITAAFAAYFAVFYTGLSAWVIIGRVSDDSLHGDGGHSGLAKRIRAHGNFVEYVPLILIVSALLEASGARAITIEILLGILVVARILHPIGIFAAKNSPRQFACRGGGIIATLLVLLIAAVLLFVRVV